jgi:hypothetical protein
MYIKIDEKNRVVLQIADKFAEGMEHDNVTTFRVETVPSAERGEILCFNPETKTFYTEKKPEPTEEQKEKAKAKENKLRRQVIPRLKKTA